MSSIFRVSDRLVQSIQLDFYIFMETSNSQQLKYLSYWIFKESEENWNSLKE